MAYFRVHLNNVSRVWPLLEVAVLLFLGLSGVVFVHGAQTTTPVLNVSTTSTGTPGSCIVDGVYYISGEQWSNPTEPCTLYECFANGTHWRLQNECLYKGECKPDQAVWTEGCTTYRCESGPSHASYRIQETGCATNFSGKSSCLAVGTRESSGCDVVECQLLDSRLQLATIKHGCKYNGTCYTSGSYWHDGCVIYACNGSTSGASVQIKHDVTMAWPLGNYGLLQPSSGCPGGSTMTWTVTSPTLYTGHPSAFNNTHLLTGNFTDALIQYAVCVRDSQVSKTTERQQYKTAWEPGSYCIFNGLGACPRGFTEGQVGIYNNDTAVSNVTRNSSTDESIMNFCCRDDRKPTNEIVLPKEKSFVLFVKHSTGACQSVKGLLSTNVDITLSSSMTSRITGSVPNLQQTASNQTTLALCHYKPQDCGCRDESGKYIALNAEQDIDCVLKKCVERNGKHVLQVISGGCVSEGQCRGVNTVWSDMTGETCFTRTCTRQSIAGDVSFSVEEKARGCRDGDVCKDVGTEIYRGCYTSTCSLETKSNQPVFRVIRADCPWLDSCMPPNSTWDHNCMSYRCDMTLESGHYKWNVQPVSYGCRDARGTCYDVGQNVTDQCYEAVCKLNENKTVVYMDVTRGGCHWKDNQCKPVNATWSEGCQHFRCEWNAEPTGFTATVNATKVSCAWNNTCYEHNATWSVGCVDYTCDVQRDTDEVNWRVKTVALACTDFDGRCVGIGENVIENCVTYTCTKRGDRLGLEPVTMGCQWNNSCVPENAVWTDDARCVDYTCQRSDTFRGTVMQVSVAGYGCVFNNTCKAVNATWQDGCRTRKCVVKLTNTTIQRSISPITAGCDDQGICRKVDFVKVTDSCTEYKCVFNETYKDAFFTLSRGACRTRSGDCKIVGTQWTELNNGLCLDYECRKARIGYVSRMLQKKCIDANGRCQPAGATGFPADMDGILHTDCSCVQTGENITVRCKKGPSTP